MSKLHAERLIKKNEPGTTIPKGSFRLRFMKDELLFKKHFKAILLQAPPAVIPTDSLDGAEGNFVVDKTEKGQIEGTFNRDAKITPKADVIKTTDYDVTPAAEGVQSPLQSMLFQGVKELEEINNGHLLAAAGSKENYVIKIKQALNELSKETVGYIALEETEQFDLLTQSAVSVFQKKYQLKRGTNGVVGYETIRKLDELLLAKTYKWQPSVGKEKVAAPTAVTTYQTAKLPLKPEQKPPDPAKVKKAIYETMLFKGLSGWEQTKNTSFLDSVAILSDTEMKLLGLGIREEMIRLMADFIYAGSDTEMTIARLIATTPEGKEAGRLLNWLKDQSLLKKLESKIQGGNYKAYQAALRMLYFNGMDVEVSAEKMQAIEDKRGDGKKKSVGEWAKDDHIFYWLSPGLISMAKFHGHRINYSDMKINDAGKIMFSIQHTYVLMADPEVKIELDPYEMVAVNFITKTESIASEGENLVYMPAINLMALYNEQFNQEAITAIDAAMVLAGGVGLLTAGSRLARLVAALDVALGASSLVVNNYRVELSESEAGKRFLKYWDIANALIAIYGVGRMVVAAPGLVSNVSRSWKTFIKEYKGSTIPRPNIEQISNSVAKMEHAGETAEMERIIRQEGGESTQLLKENKQWGSTFWNKNVTFRNRKVYQRDDLIDPHRVDPETGLTNLERMKKGYAPIGPDGKKIELHHLIQKDPGPVAEVTSTFHTDNKEAIHIWANEQKPLEFQFDRSKFDYWRGKYWEFRANDFEH